VVDALQYQGNIAMLFPKDGECEARLRYKGGDYQVVVYGSYVICAVTGEQIALDDLRYWSLERQEPYVSCQASYERELKCNPTLREFLDRGGEI